MQSMQAAHKLPQAGRLAPALFPGPSLILAVQEMLGIAEAMLAAPLPEVISHFREAFHRYSTLVAGSSEPRRAVHLATRAMMLAAVHAQQHRSFHDAHVCLMRAQLQVWGPD